MSDSKVDFVKNSTNNRMYSTNSESLNLSENSYDSQITNVDNEYLAFRVVVTRFSFRNASRTHYLLLYYKSFSTYTFTASLVFEVLTVFWSRMSHVVHLIHLERKENSLRKRELTTFNVIFKISNRTLNFQIYEYFDKHSIIKSTSLEHICAFILYSEFRISTTYY